MPPWGSDPAFFIIWSRGSFDGICLTGLMRKIAHGPIHLLVDSAQEIGLYWDSEQAGWIRPGLPPLRMMTGPIQHFRSPMWLAWQEKVAADLCKRKRKGFGRSSVLICMALINYLPLLT